MPHGFLYNTDIVACHWKTVLTSILWRVSFWNCHSHLFTTQSSKGKSNENCFSQEREQKRKEKQARGEKVHGRWWENNWARWQETVLPPRPELLFSSFVFPPPLCCSLWLVITLSYNQCLHTRKRCRKKETEMEGKDVTTDRCSVTVAEFVNF